MGKNKGIDRSWPDVSPMGVLLKAAILVFILPVLGQCKVTQSWADTRRQDSAATTMKKPQVQLHHSEMVFRLFNTSLDFGHAKRFCSAHFGTLPTEGRRDMMDGVLQLLRAAELRVTVWAIDPSTSGRDTLVPSEQRVTVQALSFPLESAQAHAQLRVPFPALGEVSVCVRLQWDQRHTALATVFSYAAPVFTNELLLRGRPDSTGRVLLALIVQGKHGPFRASFANDGAWHHVCVAWRRADSLWAVHVDGERGDADKAGDVPRDVPRDLHGAGIFVLGQDQDSFGGNFSEPFVGNLTELSVWNVALEEWQVQALNACGTIGHASLFTWDVANVIVHPDVSQVQASVLCPGRISSQTPGCRVLDGRSPKETPHFTTVPCLQTLPFVCVTSQERMQKIKELRDSREGGPSPFLSQLMRLSNQSLAGEGLFPDETRLGWEQSSRVLDVSQKALQESPGGLEPFDMLSLIQLLRRTADVVNGGNQSRKEAAAFSRSFLAVADRMIDQENVPGWEAVKEVVSGPMAVVRSIDHLVTNLESLLVDEDDDLLINGDNIKLEVQQRSLETDTSNRDFCRPAAENKSRLDCIEVPSQIMKTLHSNGFQKITLMNTWYGSLHPFFTRDGNTSLFPVEGNINLLPAVSDGTQKYIGAVLGSSVISSMVLGQGRRISTAVRFHLQHRHQNLPGTEYDPVCAFWDFNLMPEAGGGWSTRGCHVIHTWPDSTSCYCNHTTNFALLLQVYEVQRSPESEISMQMLTFIGCGVSLCCLTFTFILFIVVGVPKSDRTTVHKNLIAALGIAELLLMCSDTATGNQELCLVVTALLHLFFTASFTWMLVEGLLLWSKVVSVNISEDRRMKLYYAIGWGCPVIVVGLTLAVSFGKYKADDRCWLNVQHNTIWAFAGPVLFILSVNAVVLWRVVVVTISSARRRAKMLTPSSLSRLHALGLVWAATRPVLILLPVLGLTWICGILVHLSVVLAYLFIALNAFQGLYIFLVYAIYNSEVRTAITRIQEKRKALSFTNCSQPIGFLPSQRTPNTSWACGACAVSSPETSDTSGQGGVPTSGSVVIQNESFMKEHMVSFSLRPATADQVVQLTAFKPSGC
uniref:Adhesion G protein-coupled receptor D2 n=1 Tax=Paramormyrops kingsleyae TaxID=1676925 RepID=A0A3B3QT47_9TELE|nr:adhesion G-protein coupled receptor D2 isoform X2 [Paramormyrops kingsleyae]XP_023696451.1 adhesion G-protein coupled receptor D2 isoform X2 [Paramormyrops kingsleyae]